MHNSTQASSRALPRRSHQHLVPIHELLTPGFLSRHTKFTSIDAFLSAGMMSAERLVDIDLQIGSNWDDFIRRHPAIQTGMPCCARPARNG